MTRSTRASMLTLQTLAAACLLAAAGCSSSNEPATGSTSSSSGSGSGTAGTNTSGSAGTTSSSTSGTSSAGTTASSSGGSTATSGSTGTTTGGSDTTTTTGSTGDTTTASTGSTSTGATTGTTGTTTGGTTGDFSPLCEGLTTEAGPAPTKAGVCTANDPQLCYKTCGPQSIGFKSETCTAGAYAEQSGCSFPADQDYSCYKIPTTIDYAACGTATAPPQASQPCTAPACTVCSDMSGMYLDSKGAAKVGYCVCPAPGASGTSKWSCASATAWPCPMGQGC